MKKKRILSTDSSAKNYLAAFQKALPLDYELVIANAGGNVLRAMPELGGLEVASYNPDFLSNLK